MSIVKYVVINPILSTIGFIDYVIASLKSPMECNIDIPNRKGPFTKKADKDPGSDYQSILLKESPHLNPDYKNLYEEFKDSANKFTNQDIIGTREKLSVKNETQPDGKVLKKFEMSDHYTWQTYSKVLKTVNSLSNGFLKHGLKSNDNIVLVMETRSEWLMSALACFRIKVPIVTLYATLGVEALCYGINQTNTKFLITSGDQLKKIEEILDKIPSVTHIIVVSDKTSGENMEEFKVIATKHDKKAFKFNEVIEDGENSEVITDFESPTKDDLAIIMYTSGSTGNPKGVMISHMNLYNSLKSLFSRLQKLEPGKDIYVAYLPLAHVLELMSELAYVVEGIKIGYSSPQTLTDASTAVLKGGIGDLRVLNPSIMHAVPAVLERLKKAVTSKVNMGSKTKQALFNTAFAKKLKFIKRGQSTQILDKILFKKVSNAVVGNSLRYIVAGGALLNAEVQEFVQVCFCNLQQAYGLTETCAGGTTQLAFDSKTNTSGSVIPTVSIRLVDWDEGGYRNTDTPNPRGEVYIGGDSVTLGYYKNQELTDQDYKVINGVRYFATGDIGEFESDGNLKIIDRKKDLVKLTGGEFVSLNKVENILKLLPMIENCCVLANGAKANCACIVSPIMKTLEDELAKEKGTEESLKNIQEIKDDKEKNLKLIELLYKNTQVIDRFAKDVMAHGLAKKLAKFEIPTKFLFVPESWLPDTGLVTDSLKIKRKAIEKFYKTQIEEFY